MMDYVDTGRRCEKHIGEVFPVRCIDCDNTTTTIYAPLDRHGDCTLHPGYPAPCRRCKEDHE